MKNFIAVIAALLSCGISYAADNALVNFDNPSAESSITAKLPNISAVPAASSASLPRRDAQKEWTIMVYVNGKNSLADAALKDVNEMETIGSNDKMNIVVELGYQKFMPTPGWGDNGQNEKIIIGSQRMLVQKDSNFNNISSPILSSANKVDMGDWKHLVEFGTWAKQNFPAKKYMLIVWNHGNGWRNRRPPTMHTRGISYDDETGNHITTVQLGQAIAAIGGVDVYGSDACLMQMVEVAYEIKNNTAFIVGSEETEPGDGYDYQRFLGKLAATPEAAPEQLATFAVQAYADSYAPLGTSVTQSYIRVAAMPQLIPLLNKWAEMLMASTDQLNLKNAKAAAQQFDDSDSKDLYHFAKLVRDGSQDPAVKNMSNNVMNYLAVNLIGLNTHMGPRLKDSYGISIYIPTFKYDPLYDTISFARDTVWGKFAKYMSSF